MRLHDSSFLALSILVLSSSSVWSDVCDNRPSELVGGVLTGAATTAGAAATAAGQGLAAAGFYTLPHSITGATMLASTAGGASGAGTVGIMGGTAGLVGSSAGALMSPFVVVGGAIVAVGVGGFEAGCSASDAWYADRITDFDTVYATLDRIAVAEPSRSFRLIGVKSRDPLLQVTKEDGEIEQFRVRDLYFVNGELMHRDWFANSSLGTFDLQ